MDILCYDKATFSEQDKLYLIMRLKFDYDGQRYP